MSEEIKETTYWDYIQVEQLLTLQTGLPQQPAVSNDEKVFIVVHQIYELWFSLLLNELTVIRDRLKAAVVPEDHIAKAVQGFERCVEIFRVAIEHFRVVETITTRDYLEFRDKLFPASGFQSAQLRELEILMGLADEDRIPFGGHDSWKAALRLRGGGRSPAMARINARQADKPDLKTVVENWLWRTPIDGSQPGGPGDNEVVREFLNNYMKGHEQIVEAQLKASAARHDSESEQAELKSRYSEQLKSARAYLIPDKADKDLSKVLRVRASALFIASYRELPLLAWPRKLIETLIDFEQHFVIFRQRHARMVEKVIGRRPGSGGSAGVAYLDATALRYRIFKVLWGVRTMLLPSRLMPKLKNKDFYKFNFQSIAH